MGRAVDESIEVTGDEHHVFFEGVYELDSEDGIRTFQLAMGS